MEKMLYSLHYFKVAFMWVNSFGNHHHASKHCSLTIGLHVLSSIDIPCWYCSFKQSDADSDLINLCSIWISILKCAWHPLVKAPLFSPLRKIKLSPPALWSRELALGSSELWWCVLGVGIAASQMNSEPSSWLCNTYFPSRGARHQFLSFVGKLWRGQVWDSTQ